MNWIKMCDQAGSVLRVEMVINAPEAIKVCKQVRRNNEQAVFKNANRLTEQVPHLYASAYT